MSGQDFVEGLHVINDGESGLTGIIAIHSTNLGPAAGGCRFWHYAEQDQLISDAVRLARGMSYKNALAGLPLGGGKAVLQKPKGDFDREDYFRAFGKAVAQLEGNYITAEDVGTSVADMQVVRSQTRFVAGLEAENLRAGGDPSPWTALGVFESMKAAASFSGLSLRGATVAVQGTGNVGAALCRLLAREGAKLIVADIDEARAGALARELGSVQAGIDDILGADADILAPCALGAILNDRTIPTIRAGLVCGAANNQLEEERHGEALLSRGIVYAPDYVVNAGGIINVCAEYLGENTHHVEARVNEIAPRLVRILEKARDQKLPSGVVADELARAKIADAALQAA